MPPANSGKPRHRAITAVQNCWPQMARRIIYAPSVGVFSQVDEGKGGTTFRLQATGKEVKELSIETLQSRFLAIQNPAEAQRLMRDAGPFHNVRLTGGQIQKEDCTFAWTTLQLWQNRFRAARYGNPQSMLPALRERYTVRPEYPLWATMPKQSDPTPGIAAEQFMLVCFPQSILDGLLAATLADYFGGVRRGICQRLGCDTEWCNRTSYCSQECGRKVSRGWPTKVTPDEGKD